MHVVDRENDDAPLKTAGWFESDQARVFEQRRPPKVERSRGLFSGSETREAAQTLYRTAEGRWVTAYHFDAPLGEQRYYLAEEDASAWLQLNGYSPEDFTGSADVSPERGPGRPEIGGRVQVRLGDTLRAVDAYAYRHGLTRADAIRRLITEALDRQP